MLPRESARKKKIFNNAQSFICGSILIYTLVWLDGSTYGNISFMLTIIIIIIIVAGAQHTDIEEYRYIQTHMGEVKV